MNINFGVGLVLEKADTKTKQVLSFSLYQPTTNKHSHSLSLFPLRLSQLRRLDNNMDSLLASSSSSSSVAPSFSSLHKHCPNNPRSVSVSLIHRSTTGRRRPAAVSCVSEHMDAPNSVIGGDGRPSAKKEAKLWGGRFEENVTDAVEKFTESISFDKALYKHDIMGSRAHASMLARQVGYIRLTNHDC